MGERSIVSILIGFLFSHHRNQGLQRLIFGLIQELQIGWLILDQERSVM